MSTRILLGALCLATLACGQPGPSGSAEDSAAAVSSEQTALPAELFLSELAPASSAPQPAPTQPQAVYLARERVTPTQLADWVDDEQAAPEVRYAALRRLEREDPAAALEMAFAQLDDEASLVRLNAIALLARSDDPQAQAVLEALDPRSRRLATRLTERR